MRRQRGGVQPEDAKRPLVALIGRPNVGKSSLFNRLVGGRPALVEDMPGVTRDRRYGTAEWTRARFRVVDTGGLDPSAEGVLGAMRSQTLRAVDEADVLVFVLDVVEGPTAVDDSVSKLLRRQNKPVVIAANKVDSAGRESSLGDIYALGWPEVFPVSASHGRGVGDLLDRVVQLLGPGVRVQDLNEVASDEDADEANDDEANDDEANDDADEDSEVEGDAPTDVDLRSESERAGALGSDDDVDDDDVVTEVDLRVVPSADDVTELASPELASPDDDDQEITNVVAVKDIVPRSHKEKDDDQDEAEPTSTKFRFEAVEGPTRIAFVGKPNAGKSSLVNRLLGEERVLVHDQPGTTRDPIDTPFSAGGESFVLVDTAGMRRKRAIDTQTEAVAAIMAEDQLTRCDVAVLVIDAGQGATAEDARIAGLIEDSGRAAIVLLNKKDSVPRAALNVVIEKAREAMPFLSWAPMLTTSALTGAGVRELPERVARAFKQACRRISTGELNRFLEATITDKPPPAGPGGRHVKLYFITQAETRPPTFVISTNHPLLVQVSYRRFLANQLRKTYGFEGTPLRIVLRPHRKKRLSGGPPAKPPAKPPT